MKRLMSILAGLLVLASLAGCTTSTTVPIQYYVLAPQVSGTDAIVERVNKPAIVIESVELAAYLQQSGMIIQTGDNQLQVSKQHLWAESLELAVPKALIRKLQSASDQYSYYLKSLDWVGQTDYRLRIRIDSLNATDQGEVVAVGRYQLIPAKEPTAAIVVDFNLQRDIQRDGYENTVKQIDGLLGEIAAAIIASVDAAN